jgi:Ni/Co efflux regulator RcnB
VLSLARLARRRYVSTDISIDSLLVKLQKNVGYFGPLLYTWMLPHAGDDCHITDDLDELKLMVIPGFNVEPTEIEDAINAMVELGLLRRDDGGLYFPPRSFYKHQSYIPEAKRWQETEAIPEDYRKSPQIAEERRVLPQNTASPSPSPSYSPSPTPSPSPSPSARAPANGGTVEFHPTTDPPWPDDSPSPETFVARYVREHQLRNAGNPPSSNEQAEAKRLERDFTAAVFIEIASDYDWLKHPNYLRKALNDPNRKRPSSNNAGQSRRASGANSERPSEAARRLGIGGGR